MTARGKLGLILLLLVIGACLLIALATVVSPILVYRIFPTDRFSYRVLNQSIRQGDSYEKVKAALGEGDEELKGRALIEEYAQIKETDPTSYNQLISSYQDGIEEDDTFVIYNIGEQLSIQLHFRKGRLIHYDPEAFSDDVYQMEKQDGIIK